MGLQDPSKSLIRALGHFIWEFDGSVNLNFLGQIFSSSLHFYFLEINPSTPIHPPDMDTTERLDAGADALAAITTEDLTNANTITKWLLSQPENWRPT